MQRRLRTLRAALFSQCVAGSLLPAVLALLVVWAWHLKHPLLLGLRPVETPLLLLVAVFGWFAAPFCSGGRRWLSHLARGLCVVVLATTLGQEIWFQWQRWQVLRAAPLMRVIGAHFVVGYRDYASLAPLAGKGLIGGIYLSKRNVSGRKLDEVRQEIAKLQVLRQANGLPPLFVAADQEGGEVNHLSPLLPAQPGLAKLAELKAVERRDAAFGYGRQQGALLRQVGVNLNLSPVVDLKPARHGWWPDLNTRVHKRAISGNPAVVGEIAGAYVAGLQSEAVQGTLKHFPGLGRVQADTHHAAARLGLPLAQLEAEWAPFRLVGERTGAAIMVGHVTLDAVDARYPASLSPAVIGGVLRRQWQYQGLVLTDDLNMGAVYGLGVANAARAGLQAGADLLLVTYDPDQYYRALYGTVQAYRHGAIDDRLLAAGKGRIARHWLRHSAVSAALAASRLAEPPKQRAL